MIIWWILNDRQSGMDFGVLSCMSMIRGKFRGKGDQEFEEQTVKAVWKRRQEIPAEAVT